MSSKGTNKQNCEGEVDTSKTNVFTYVRDGNLIENLGTTKYIYLYTYVGTYKIVLIIIGTLFIAPLKIILFLN